MGGTNRDRVQTSLGGLVRFFLCGPDEVTPTGCPSGGAQIGGDITSQGSSFFDLTPSATSDPATGANTATPGQYCWRAEYLGRPGLISPASFTNATTQCFSVSRDIAASPPIVTGQLSVLGTGPGGAVSDTVYVRNPLGSSLCAGEVGCQPSGSVRFFLCRPNETTSGG